MAGGPSPKKKKTKASGDGYAAARAGMPEWEKYANMKNPELVTLA